MKTCSKCNRLKNLNNYSFTINGNKRADCKNCQSEYHKIYYLNNKEQMMNNQKLRNAKKKKNENIKRTI